MSQYIDQYIIEYIAKTQKAAADTKKYAAANDELANSYSRIPRSQRQFTQAVQNSSYQIADFAVQVGGGVSAMKAFSQQAPQLLAGFGTIGAVAGAAVAVLAAGANSLFNFGEAAEKASKKTNEMADAIKELISPSTGLSNLNKLLEESESRFAGLATSLRNIALKDARNELESLEAEVSKLVSTLSQPSLGNNTIARYLVLTGKGLSDVDAKFQATTENIQELYDVNEETAKSINNLSRQFADGLIDVEQFADAVLALGVDPKTEGFAELLALLKQIATQAATVKDLSKIDIELNVRGDDLQEAIDAWDEYMAGLKEYADNVKRGLDPTIELTEKVSKLKEAHDAGYLTMEQYNKELENITGLKKRSTALDDSLALFDKEILGLGKDDGITSLLEEIQTESERWAEQFASTLVSGLAEGKLAFKDFADYVLQQLARIAISKALEPLFDAFRGLFPTSAETGAPAAQGLIAVPANDLPISREMSSAQPMIVGVPRMSAPSKSSSPVTVNVYNQGSNEVEVNERKTTNGIEVDVLIKSAVKRGIAAGEFDKVMATSFGTRRLAY